MNPLQIEQKAIIRKVKERAKKGKEKQFPISKEEHYNWLFDRQLEELSELEKRKRVPIKMKMIGEWQAYLEDSLAKKRKKDNIASLLIIWHGDLGLWEKFFELMEKGIEYGLESPISWKRSLSEIKIDELFNYSKGYLKRYEDSYLKYFWNYFPDEKISFLSLKEQNIYEYLKIRFEYAYQNKEYDIMNAIYEVSDKYEIDLKVKTKMKNIEQSDTAKYIAFKKLLDEELSLS